MRLSGLTYESLVDGPGMRVVVFVQGCNINCPECHNVKSQPVEYGGQEYTVSQVVRMVQKKDLNHTMTIRGLTFSGGEPFLQAHELAQVAEKIKAQKKDWDIVTYTGYTYEDLLSRPNKDIHALLSLTDYLIDGPYIHEKRDLTLRFRGSSNQRVIDMNATRKYGKLIKLD